MKADKTIQNKKPDNSFWDALDDDYKKTTA